MTASPRRPGRCGFCGRPLVGSIFQTEVGEAFCAAHQTLPACRFCRAPIGAAGKQLCSTCAATAVTDQAAVKRTVPSIRDALHAMGIRLVMAVQVRLVSADDLSRLLGHATGAVTGVTVVAGQHVTNLSIVAGMPAIEFGAVVAHECMHAWMAQRGFPSMSPQLEEGLCELASYGWLRGQPDPRARLLRRAIERGPDQTYGPGFRMVKAAVERHGLRAVLQAAHRTGRLPDDDPRHEG